MPAHFHPAAPVVNKGFISNVTGVKINCSH